MTVIQLKRENLGTETHPEERQCEAAQGKTSQGERIAADPSLRRNQPRWRLVN